MIKLVVSSSRWNQSCQGRVERMGSTTEIGICQGLTRFYASVDKCSYTPILIDCSNRLPATLAVRSPIDTLEANDSTDITLFLDFLLIHSVSTSARMTDTALFAVHGFDWRI